MKRHISFQKITYVIFMAMIFSYQKSGSSVQGVAINDELFEEGNWIKNKEWTGRAEEVLADIDEVHAQMEEYDALHYKKIYVDIDKKLNLFYKEMGTSQEAINDLVEEASKDLKELLKKSLEEIKNPNEKRIDAEQKAFEFERDMKKTEVDLQQLKVDVQLVSDFDKALQAFQLKTEELLSLGQQKRNEASGICAKMKSLKNDQKSRELYYQVRGMFDQMQDLLSFFKNRLSQETDALISKIEAHLTQVEQLVKSLEAKGAVINNRVMVLEQLKVSELTKLKAEEEQRARDQERNKKNLRIEKRKKNFSEKLSNYWSIARFVLLDLYQSIHETVISFLQDWGIVSKKIEKPIVKEKQETKEKEVEQQEPQIKEKTAVN